MLKKPSLIIFFLFVVACNIVRGQSENVTYESDRVTYERLMAALQPMIADADQARSLIDRGDIDAAKRIWEQIYRGILQYHIDRIERTGYAADITMTELGFAFENLGLAFENQGYYSEAESAYGQVLAIEERITERITKIKEDHIDGFGYIDPQTRHKMSLRYARLLQSLANVYALQGRFADSEATYKKSLDFGEKTLSVNDPLVARINVGMATLYAGQGRFIEADVYVRRGLNLLLCIDGNVKENESLHQAMKAQAEIYRDQRRYADAEPLFKEIHDRVRLTLGRNHLKTCVAITDMAFLSTLRNHFDVAEPLYQRARDQAQRLLSTEHPILADIHYRFGIMYLQSNRPVDARPLLLDALAVREKIYGKDHPATAAVVEALAQVYEALGETGEAEKYYDRSIAAFNVHPSSAVDGCIRFLSRAKFYRNIHRNAEAMADLKRAIELSLEVRKHTSGTDEQRAQTFAGFYTLFETMVDWQQESGDMNEVYDAMERSRAQGLQDLIDTNGIDFFAGMNPADERRLRADDKAVRIELASLQKQLDNVVAAEDIDLAEKERRCETLLNKLREAQRKSVEVQATIHAASPIYRMTVGEDRRPISLTSVQAELERIKGVALEYLIGTEKSFVLFYGNVETRLLPLRLKEAEAKLFGVESGWLTSAKMDAILQNEEETGVLQLVTRRKNITPEGNPDAATVTKLAVLWRMLIPDETIRTLLLDGRSVDQLLILPDGPLARLPFEMLVVDADSPTTTYLLDRGPATLYAPSASLFFNLSNRKAAESERQVLTVGDPTYEQDSASTPDTEESGLMAARASRSFARFGTLSLLPWTAREVEWITNACRQAGHVVTTLVKTDATEANVRKNISGQQIVHLACHGLADDSYGNMFGSLALTVGDPNDPNDDGFLTLAEMFGLDLRVCELAVLSACETNLGPNQHGEGTWSMGRGMVASGAKRVVTTDWQVADKASAYLAFWFIDTVNRTKTPAYAEALRQAKRSIRESRETAAWHHPYYWAPFVLIGPN